MTNVDEWIETTDYKGYRIKIVQDLDCENPRQDRDSFTKMYCWHRRRNLGDDHKLEDTEAMFKDIVGYDFMEKLDAWRDRKYEKIPWGGPGYRELQDAYKDKLCDEVQRVAVILPIHAYEHGGITIRTSSFSDPWDSGQVGWIYILNADAMENWGAKSMLKKIHYSHDNSRKTVRERAIEYMEAEIEEYDHWLNNNCWGYKIYQLLENPDFDEESDNEEDRFIESEELDSCWGFICDHNGYVLEEAKSIADHYIEKANKSA